jgi:hypothetical protein
MDSEPAIDAQLEDGEIKTLLDSAQVWRLETQPYLRSKTSVFELVIETVDDTGMCGLPVALEMAVFLIAVLFVKIQIGADRQENVSGDFRAVVGRLSLALNGPSRTPQRALKNRSWRHEMRFISLA